MPEEWFGARMVDDVLMPENEDDPAEVLYRKQRERMLPEVRANILRIATLLDSRRDMSPEPGTTISGIISRINAERLEALFPTQRPGYDPAAALEGFSINSRRLANDLQQQGNVEQVLRGAAALGRSLTNALYQFAQYAETSSGVADVASVVRLEVEPLIKRLEIQIEDALRSEAGSIIRHAREAAGISASTELWKAYSGHATSEGWRSAGWTAGLFALVGSAVFLASFIISRNPVVPFSAQEVSRLALVVPVLLLAAYASRQARFHRDSASRARWIAVQLRTVLAFSDALDTEDKKAIMKSLGMSIFGASPGLTPGSAETTFGLGGEVIEALRAVAARKSDGTK